jgi:hypothetical protein
MAINGFPSNNILKESKINYPFCSKNRHTSLAIGMAACAPNLVQANAAAA